MLEPLTALSQQVGIEPDAPTTTLTDSIFFSEANVDACAAHGIVPMMAEKRDTHSGWLDRQLTPAPPAPANPTLLAAMRCRRATAEGKALYGLRMCMVKPVIGIIKQAIRFRQFSVRGLKPCKASGDWCAWRSS